MIRKFRQFMKGRRGQGMTEYIIMVGLVAVAAIGIYTAFGKQIRNAMQALGHQLSGDTGYTQVTNTGDMDTEAGKAVTLGDFKNTAQ